MKIKVLEIEKRMLSGRPDLKNKRKMMKRQRRNARKWKTSDFET